MRKFNPSKIKLLRKSLNMTQDQFASSMGINKQHISYWERGQKKPDIKSLELVANTFNLSMDYFFDEIKYSHHKNKKAKATSVSNE